MILETDINSMKSKERLHFIRDNIATCHNCNKTKRLGHFYDRITIVLYKECRLCRKNAEEAEITKMVLDVMLGKD